MFWQLLFGEEGKPHSTLEYFMQQCLVAARRPPNKSPSPIRASLA